MERKSLAPPKKPLTEEELFEMMTGLKIMKTSLTLQKSHRRIKLNDKTKTICKAIYRTTQTKRELNEIIEDLADVVQVLLTWLKRVEMSVRMDEYVYDVEFKKIKQQAKNHEKTIARIDNDVTKIEEDLTVGQTILPWKINNPIIQYSQVVEDAFALLYKRVKKDFATMDNMQNKQIETFLNHMRKSAGHSVFNVIPQAEQSKCVTSTNPSTQMTEKESSSSLKGLGAKKRSYDV